MSGVCSTDRWSCPYPTCGALRSRGTQTQEAWLAALRRVQAAHGARHARTEALAMAS